MLSLKIWRLCFLRTDSVAKGKGSNFQRSKGSNDITQGSSLQLLQELGPKPVVVQRQANEWKMCCFSCFLRECVDRI